MRVCLCEFVWLFVCVRDCLLAGLSGWLIDCVFGGVYVVCAFVCLCV